MVEYRNRMALLYGKWDYVNDLNFKLQNIKEITNLSPENKKLFNKLEKRINKDFETNLTTEKGIAREIINKNR